jgi:hypothetical protein
MWQERANDRPLRHHWGLRRRLVTFTGRSDQQHHTQIASAISGGGTPRILIVANRGHYPVPMKKPGNLASDNSSSDTLNDGAVYTINADTSAATSEVVIEGMSDDLTPLEAILLSDRIRPYTSQNKAHRRYSGQGGFDVQSDNLIFRNIKFRDFGYAVQITGTCDNVAFEDIALDNVRRGIWLKSGATLTNSKIIGIVGKGTSKTFIKLEGTYSAIEIGDFELDGDGQSGDNFALGIHLDGTSDDVWVHDGKTGNYRIGLNDPDYTDYWNCDGLAAEGTVTKLRVDNVESWGNTDGGFDIKAPDAVLTNCISRENKRNYRLWHSGITLVECEGYRPVHPGGSGSACQIWAGTNGANGGQRIIGGVFDNEDATYTVIDNSATNPVRVEGAEIRVPNASVPISSGGGHTADDRTRIVYTKVRPVLKTADFLAATPVAFMGLRLLDGNYARSPHQGSPRRYRRDTGHLSNINRRSRHRCDRHPLRRCGRHDRHDLRPVRSWQERNHGSHDQGVPHLDRLGDHHDRHQWQALRLHRRRGPGLHLQHPDADRYLAVGGPRRLAWQWRGEQHGRWAVHEPARLVQHQHRRRRHYSGDPDRPGRRYDSVLELAGVPEQRSARRRRDFLRHRRADQHDLRRHERLATPEQRHAGPGGILCRIQWHAHRPGLRRQLDVPITARVVRRRMVVLLVRAQRSRSRRAIRRREGILRPAVVVIASWIRRLAASGGGGVARRRSGIRAPPTPAVPD